MDSETAYGKFYKMRYLQITKLVSRIIKLG